MSTRAIQFLKQTGISFDVIQYEHEEKGAEFAASKTGFPLEKTVKTLVADMGNQRYVLALMPGNKKLDFKKLAALQKAKRAAMADQHTAERLTGYHVGGISPFGIRRRLDAIMDRGIMQHDTVIINGGLRGTMLEMNPMDIAKLLNCPVTDLAR